MKIYCFEPNPENARFLSGNISRNFLQDQISVFPHAIAAKKEKRQLYLRESPHSSFDKRASDKKTLSVQCVSLNDILDDRSINDCQILKLDCEGAEYEALYALSPANTGKIKKIVMEYHDDLKNTKHTLVSLVAYLRQFGFELTHQRVSGLHGGGGEIGTAWFEQLS